MHSASIYLCLFLFRDFLLLLIHGFGGALKKHSRILLYMCVGYVYVYTYIYVSMFTSDF